MLRHARRVERLVQRQPGLNVVYLWGYTDTTLMKDGQMDATVELLQKHSRPTR